MLFAALAFVACEKEKGDSLNFTPAKMIPIIPSQYNVGPGSNITVKTARPAFLVNYSTNNFLFDSEVDDVPSLFPYEMNYEYFSVVQTTADTFEITPKLKDEPYNLTLKFGKTSDKVEERFQSVIFINYTPAK